MVFPAFASWELTRNSGKASITNMSSDSKPQMELKADVKRWLKARGLDYKWLAEQCFVSEVTVYNWMAKKKIPEVKEHIIRSLMTEMPVTLPSVKVETESRVILQLPPDVQAALECKALDSKMTLTDFLSTKSMRLFAKGLPPLLPWSMKSNARNFRKTRIDFFRTAGA